MRDIIRHILKEDKKDRFLNYVINDLIADTIIDYDKDFIYFYANHMPLPLSIFYSDLTKQHSKFLATPLPSFLNHCKERYALTEDEVNYVWELYKTIMKDKITNKGNSINESEDKKERFINAILNDMINKTEFKYMESGGKKLLSVRLFTDIFFGSFYVLGQGLNDRYVDRYNRSKEEDVSNRTIDLTKDMEERERYIYEIYHNYNVYGINFNTFEELYKRYIDEVVSIIKEKIKPNQTDNINESEDKREIFINAIVDDLISKARIDYDKRIIYQPSGFYLSFGDLDSRIRDKRINSPSSMKDYIRHYYQLNNEYTFKVFKLYLVALKDKITKPLNESENKRERFLQFILDDLVSKTKISDDDGIKVKFNFLKKYGFVNPAPIKINLINKPSVEKQILLYFSLYCKDVYGLSSSDIEFVWLEYKDIIKDKITNKGNINESVNKKERFLNYVINDLIADTKIDFDLDRLVLPFNVIIGYSYPSRYSSISPIPNSITIKPPEGFVERCKNHYTLPEQYINMVWLRLREYIIKLKNQKNLNESEDKKERFLQFVVDDMINNTLINFKNNTIQLPYDKLSLNLNFDEWLKLDKIWIIHDSFKTFVIDRYGLTEDEIGHIWDDYNQIIKKKITKP